jgi:hypothetical protein
VLNIVQTVAIIIAALASAYAVATSELGRRLDVRRRRVERVFEATLALAEAAVRHENIQGQGPALVIAQRRLRAEIQIVGVTGFESTELMIRDAPPDAIVRQSEAAFVEIGERLDELAPRPLLDVLLHRPVTKRDIRLGLRI